jgi:hypothetical protein
MDGAMIVAAMYCLNIFNPGRLLGPGGVSAIEMASLGSKSEFLEKPKEVGELRAETYHV